MEDLLGPIALSMASLLVGGGLSRLFWARTVVKTELIVERQPPVVPAEAPPAPASHLLLAELGTEKRLEQLKEAEASATGDELQAIIRLRRQAAAALIHQQAKQ